MRKAVLAAVVVGVTTITGHVLAQGRGGSPRCFRRSSGRPAIPPSSSAARGSTSTTCSACHGADLRGGGMGGPNLLRSQTRASDQHGELILPIVRGARADKGMPALPMPDAGRDCGRRVHPQRRRHRPEQGAPPAERGASAQRHRRRRRCRRNVFRGQVQQLPLADRRSAGHRRRACRRARRCRTAGSPVASGGGRRGRGAAPEPPARLPRRIRAPSPRRSRCRRARGSRARWCASTTSSSRCGRPTARSARVRRDRRRPEGRDQRSAGGAQSAARRRSPTRTCTTSRRFWRHSNDDRKNCCSRARSCCAAPVLLTAQGRGLDPAQILKPLADSWMTYSGDYSGKRYSALDADQPTTVKNLTLAWVTQLDRRVARTAGGGFGGGGGGGGRGADRRRRRHRRFPVGRRRQHQGVDAVGGRHALLSPAGQRVGDRRARRPRAVALLLEDAGRHAHRQPRLRRCGTTTLYMETPDNYLVSLEAKTGKERWHKVISDFNQQYFSTMAPVVIGNHVLAGTGNDLDAPGFLQSFDPETGELQWKLYTVPMNQGDPGLETWPSLDAARHGGAQAWLPGVYDPETKLYIFGTGNPTPGLHRRTRRRRQPLHVLADRRQRRHRQDGVVLPDVAARHARLGLGADAGPRSTRRSTGSRASSSRPRRATAISSCSIASPVSTCVTASTGRRPTGSRASTTRGGRSAIR